MTFFLEDATRFAAHNAEVMGNGDSMFVVQGVTIGSSTDWDGVTATTGASVQVQGTIMSVGGTGLSFSLGGNHVNVGATGAIMGSLNAGAGINAVFGHLNLTNAGEISGYYGVNCDSSDNTIYNSGHILGTNNAIHIAWMQDNVIVNSGLIESTGADAILFDSNSDGYAKIDNSGTIRATTVFQYAINYAVGWGDVINTGHIIGDVRLGDSNSTYDGSAGTIDGTVYGGPGNDTILTGAGRDILLGRGGADLLEGGAGRDIFSFGPVSDSTGSAHDTIVDFDFGRDLFSFGAIITGIDTTVATGKLRGDHFNADLQKAANATHLLANHAVLFAPNSGSEKGDIFLVVDANGVAGYQADADFVVELHNPDNISAFSLKDFT